MANFVCVHGAWHGGWCWDELRALLHAQGHHCLTPTLTGLGERQHLLRADITPDTHVADIVNLIHWRDLRDVILVGHSYGGMVITGAAGHVPERLSGMIYLDAMVPEQSNQSLFARGAPERMAAFQKQIDAGAIGLEPDLFDAWSADATTRDWLKSMCSPQPVGTFTHGVTLTGREAEVAHKHYILCSRNHPSMFWHEHDKLAGRAGWSRETLGTMHDAMVEDAPALAAMFTRFAAGLPNGHTFKGSQDD